MSTTRPVEADIDALEITYASVVRVIEEKVTEFAGIMEMQPTASSDKIKVAVMFYERRPKKSWFVKADEDTWEIAAQLTQARTEQQQLQAQAQLVRSLCDCLTTISNEANEHRDRIPPLVTSDPFPFQIAVSSQPTTFWNALTKMIPSN
nr:hypothetical protein HK105_006434 [Polyrhizophydium stewartii]